MSYIIYKYNKILKIDNLFKYKYKEFLLQRADRQTRFFRENSFTFDNLVTLISSSRRTEARVRFNELRNGETDPSSNVQSLYNCGCIHVCSWGKQKEEAFLELS